MAVLDLELHEFTASLDQLRPEAAAALTRIKEQIGLLTDDLRRISYTLHPDTLEHLGLEVALERLVDEFARHWPAPVDFAAHSLPEPIPLPVATALYRITQEALRNITKHAQDAAVDIRATGSPDTLRLRIQDKGPGFDPAAMVSP